MRFILFLCVLGSVRGQCDSGLSTIDRTICELNTGVISPESVAEQARTSILQYFYFGSDFSPSFSVDRQRGIITVLEGTEGFSKLLDLYVEEDGTRLVHRETVGRFPVNFTIPNLMYFRNVSLHLSLRTLPDYWIWDAHDVYVEEIQWYNVPPTVVDISNDTASVRTQRVCAECGVLCFSDVDCISLERYAEKVLLLTFIVVLSTTFLLVGARKGARALALRQYIPIALLMSSRVADAQMPEGCGNSFGSNMEVQQARIVDDKIEFVYSGIMSLNLGEPICFRIDSASLTDTLNSPTDEIPAELGYVKITIKDAEIRYNTIYQYETYSIKFPDDNFDTVLESEDPTEGAVPTDTVLERYYGCPSPVEGCCCDTGAEPGCAPFLPADQCASQ